MLCADALTGFPSPGDAVLSGLQGFGVKGNYRDIIQGQLREAGCPADFFSSRSSFSYSSSSGLTLTTISFG